MLPEEGARPPRPPAEERRPPEKRMRIARGTTQITLGNGQIFDCKVINLSLTGTALQLDSPRSPNGSAWDGGRAVVRHTRDGIAVEFAKAAS